MEGKVKFFNAQKGFGFITCESTGVDYFFHISDVLDQITLYKDDKVSFKTKQNPKRPTEEIAAIIKKI